MHRQRTQRSPTLAGLVTNLRARSRGSKALGDAVSTGHEDVNVAAETDKLEPLLSTTDVAEYLGVPVKTLYAWRYRREGPPAARVGRHVRYRRSDVEGWVRDQIALAQQDPLR
jgi:excisionase family DNA binding protein